MRNGILVLLWASFIVGVSEYLFQCLKVTFILFMSHHPCLFLLVNQVPGFISLIYRSSLRPGFTGTSPALLQVRSPSLPVILWLTRGFWLCKFPQSNFSIFHFTVSLFWLNWKTFPAVQVKEGSGAGLVLVFTFQFPVCLEIVSYAWVWDTKLILSSPKWLPYCASVIH